MNRSRSALVAAAFFVAGCWMALLAAEDRDAHRLPEAVKNAWQRLFPGAELDDVDDNDDDGPRMYKLEFRLPEKRGEATLRVMADGSLIESKEERKTEAAPETVRKALARAFPRGRVTETRMVTRTIVTYEVDLRDGEHRREVTVSPRGKILEVERR